MCKPIVFISHRHNDKAIADKVKDQLLHWGVGKRDIFQSSDPRRTTRAGSPLTREIHTALERTNLLILIYTDKEGDWSFPMYECGIARGKNTADTRVVVFQCTADEPGPFKGEKLVNISSGIEDLRGFAEDFHKAPGYIPCKPNGSKVPDQGFSADTPDVVIGERAKRLFDELQSVLPGARRDKHLWDFIRLRLEPEYVEEVKKLSESPEKAQKILEANLEVKKPNFDGIGYSGYAAVRQFGFDGYAEDLKLKDLVNRWKSLNNEKDSKWVYDLFETIYRAIVNREVPAISHPLKSARERSDWWFFATVTRIRVNRDNSREFDIYLIKLSAVVELHQPEK